MPPRTLMTLALALAGCGAAEERNWPRMNPAEAQAWLLAAPHQCSGPDASPFGGHFAPDGAVRDFEGGVVAGRWTITAAGAVCVQRDGQRSAACWGLTRSNYGVAAFLVTPLDRALIAAEAPQRAARPDSGRIQCTAA